MILADTSIWIDHFRRNNDLLRDALHDARVFCHPFVVGELACGNLRNRDEILHLLGAMPMLSVVEHNEALEFVARRRLAGSGLGWIDVHLLAAAAIARVRLLTLDRRLSAAANTLGLS